MVPPMGSTSPLAPSVASVTTTSRTTIDRAIHKRPSRPPSNNQKINKRLDAIKTRITFPLHRAIPAPETPWATPAAACGRQSGVSAVTASPVWPLRGRPDLHYGCNAQYFSDSREFSSAASLTSGSSSCDSDINVSIGVLEF